MVSADILNKKITLSISLNIDVNELKELIERRVDTDYDFTMEELKNLILEEYYDEITRFDAKVIVEEKTDK